MNRNHCHTKSLELSLISLVVLMAMIWGCILVGSNFESMNHDFSTASTVELAD